MVKNKSTSVSTVQIFSRPTIPRQTVAVGLVQLRRHVLLFLNKTLGSGGTKIVIHGGMLQNCLVTILFLVLAFPLFSQTNLIPVWDNGLKFKNADGSTSISVGGRMHYDVAFIKHSRELDSLAGPADDKLEVRRARLSFEGRIKNSVRYEFEFTFGEQIEYADLYIAFLKIPFIEQLTIGHFREPYGMEENTSSNSIVFMERSLTSSFAPGRNAGLMLQKPFLNNKLRLFAGLFRITNPTGSDTAAENKHSYSARLAGLPLWDSASNQAFHLGLSTNVYRPLQSTYQLNVENETHTGGTYIRSGEISNVSHVRNISGELGYSFRRLTLQSEYMHSFVRIKDNTGSELLDRLRDFNAFYATASFFLGQGQRKYDRDNNRFSAISITGDSRNVWEVAVRFSQIHLRESVEKIRKMSDVTLGLNWYYSPTWRVMFNYIHSQIEERFRANSFQMRLQATF